MAGPVLTGTPVAITWASGTNPAGQSITIPADCKAVVAFGSFYRNATANCVSTYTLAGAAADQSHQLGSVNGGETGTWAFIWYNPPTGAQTLDPAWTGTPVEGPTTIVAFVKDLDTTGWRDAKSAHATSTSAASVSLTTLANDLVLMFDQRYTGNSAGAPSTPAGFTSAQTATNNSEGARLSYKAATGASQTCASQATLDYSSVVAISLKPAPAGGAYTQSVDGTVTSAGALSKQARKLAAGTVTSSGATLKQAARALSGAVTSAGALIKRAAKTAAGSVASAGALAASKVALKVLAGTVTSAGALVKRTNAVRAGTVTSAGTLARQTSHALAGAVTSAGALVKQTRRALAGAIASAGALSGVKIGGFFTKALTGTVTSSGALVRRTNKALTGTAASSGALTRRISRALGGTVTSGGTLAKRTARALAGIVASALGVVSGILPQNIGPQGEGRVTIVGKLKRRLTSDAPKRDSGRH
jgi:hypothetical protein